MLKQVFPEKRANKVCDLYDSRHKMFLYGRIGDNMDRTPKG